MNMQETLRSHSRLTFLGSLLLLVAACSGGEPATPPAAAGTVRAELGQAERGQAPKAVELFGSVEAEQTATVAARIMARVTAVRAQPGDVVGKGQPLLDIDPVAAGGQVAQAAGARSQARAGLVLAERNYERFKALAAVDAASELELDMARMQYEQAQGAAEQAEGAVTAASSVAADSRVVAPFTGRVVRKMVEVGDLAVPGRPLVVIEAEGSQRLALAVPESVLAAAGVSVGDTLRVQIDTRPDLGMIDARVVEVAPAADSASHSYQVKVALPAARIGSGASGRAWIEVDRRTVVTVPAAAILHQGGLSLVVLRTALGRASSRIVVLGETQEDGRIEVLSGLAGSETVALGLTSVPPAETELQGLEAPRAQDPEGPAS
jgi:membrane fusion protein, multidrug efflux system